MKDNSASEKWRKLKEKYTQEGKSYAAAYAALMEKECLYFEKRYLFEKEALRELNEAPLEEK